MKNLSKKSYIFITITSIFFLILLVLFIKNFSNKVYDQQIYAGLSQTQVMTRNQALKTDTIVAINHLFELPVDEKVTIATIKDVKALAAKNQAFKNARNGDLLLIYPQRIIIYDPTNKYIVALVTTNLLR